MNLYVYCLSWKLIPIFYGHSQLVMNAIPSEILFTSRLLLGLILFYAMDLATGPKGVHSTIADFWQIKDLFYKFVWFLKKHIFIYVPCNFRLHDPLWHFVGLSHMQNLPLCQAGILDNQRFAVSSHQHYGTGLLYGAIVN